MIFVPEAGIGNFDQIGTITREVVTKPNLLRGFGSGQ
jgi:hypothetical protein